MHLREYECLLCIVGQVGGKLEVHPHCFEGGEQFHHEEGAVSAGCLAARLPGRPAQLDRE